MSQMPVFEYERAPCPLCGAHTLAEAETACQPTSDQSGEYSCPAGDHEDAEGFILQPTADSIARLDAWIGAEPQGPAPVDVELAREDRRVNEPIPPQTTGEGNPPDPHGEKP